MILQWNGHGYDMAKWTAKKLTHISPVWLQAKPSEDGGGNVACTIAGTHDIDRGWMEELRRNNPNIKIVPRILFEGWTLDVVQKFLQVWGGVANSSSSNACETRLHFAG